jgi:4-hydroxyphenylacetate 3-monooxygenase
MYFLRCRSREDLQKKMRCHKALAEATYGLIGRSPDHVAGLVTGLAMKPSVMEDLRPGFGQNLLGYYEHVRKNDLYLCFAVVPPTGLRHQQIFPGQERDDPSLQVVAEDDNGVTLSGMKMLATGAVYSDEVWVGNLTPIDDKFPQQTTTDQWYDEAQFESYRALGYQSVTAWLSELPDAAGNTPLSLFRGVTPT